MGRKGYKALILIVLIAVTSCVKDRPASTGNVVYPGGSGNVFVVCQGSLGNGNASLYAFDPQKDSVYGDLYQQANGAPLGDVFQSMTRIGNNFFLCVNNSNRISVVSATNFKLAGIINIPQPRYLLSVGGTKAYVSSLYHNKVYVINTQSLAVTDSIVLPEENTEGMCMYNNNACVCTWDTAGNHIYMIDCTSNEVVQSILVSGYAPQAVLQDKNQMLWVLGGNQYDGCVATLTRIDPSSGDILAAFTFPAAANPLQPVFNGTLDTLYFIEANYNFGTANNGIYRMAITDASLPATAFIPAQQNQYFFALGISPETGYVYVGDPLGFVEKGEVYVYRADGSIVTDFKVGLGPGGFYFDN